MKGKGYEVDTKGKGTRKGDTTGKGIKGTRAAPLVRAIVKFTVKTPCARVFRKGIRRF